MSTVSRHKSVKYWTAALLGMAIAGPLAWAFAADQTTAEQPPSVSVDHPRHEALSSSDEDADPVIRFRFPQSPTGKGTGPWKDGCFSNQGSIGKDACIDSDGRGALSAEGGAVAFPDSGEGKAIVRLGHDSGFNPGGRDFTIRATVSVTDDQVSANSNIIQKGYFDDSDGQWKLQVDNGKPSCRIAGKRDGELVDLVMEADKSIADQGLVKLECRRSGDKLTLVVDGKEFTSGADATMNIKNTRPVTLGGKGSGKQNDQLHGKLKEVAVTIG